MGKEKSTQTTVQNTTSTPTPTAEETKFNQLRLAQQEQIQPQETKAIQSGLNLSDLLLRGQALPGYLSTLPQGIDEGVTNELVNRSLRDVKSFGQQGGILDSGVLASIAGRTAGDIRLGSAQFNLNNLAQLLNLAVGGQAAPLQAPVALGGQLGQSLAGLRSVNQSGTTSTMTQNPFITGSGLLQGFGTGIGAFGALRKTS